MATADHAECVKVEIDTERLRKAQAQMSAAAEAMREMLAATLAMRNAFDDLARAARDDVS